MKINRWSALLLSLVVAAAGQMRSQSTAAQQSSGPGTAKTGTSAQQKSGPAVHPAMTNRDIIRLVQAKLADDVIISKIAHSKTRFDTSTEGLIALKQAGVSDGLIAVMMNPESASASPASRPVAPAFSGPPANSKSSAERPAPEPGLAPILFT